MYIAVLTTSEIQVYETSHMHEDGIDKEVERKYGMQPSGLPHRWTGVYSIERVREVLRAFVRPSERK